MPITELLERNAREFGNDIALDDYLFEESLKGEFVRMVQVQDLSDEEKAAVIRYGFEAISGGRLDS